MMSEKAVAACEAMILDSWIRKVLSKIRVQSPRTVFGDERLRDLAHKLEVWRKDDDLLEITPARLSFRLRGLACIGPSLINGWITEPNGKAFRKTENRTKAIRKLVTVVSQLERANVLLNNENVIAYGGRNAVDLTQAIASAKLALLNARASRGVRQLNEALRLPVNALREIGESMCGRSLRTVDRIDGEETGPYFYLTYEVISCLASSVPESELASSIRTIMRERK